jgi:hypothetical protein
VRFISPPFSFTRFRRRQGYGGRVAAEREINLRFGAGFDQRATISAYFSSFFSETYFGNYFNNQRTGETPGAT